MPTRLSLGVAREQSELAIPPVQVPVKARIPNRYVRSVALCGVGPEDPPPTGWAIPQPLRSISSIPITLPIGPNGVSVAASTRLPPDLLEKLPHPADPEG